MRPNPAIQLLAYQIAFLKDPSRFIVGMFSRQSGKTFTATLKIVTECMEAKAAGRKCKWVILSRGERQAREAMELVKLHCKAFQAGFDYHESDFLSDDKERSYQQLRTVLGAGVEIIALPANPDTARGFSANVLLDEFAFHKDSNAIWAALFPVISAGFRLIVISTPNGKGNRFHRLITGDNPAWSRHICNIYEAVKQGLPRDIDEMRTALDDEDAWAQEFECQFLDEASAWLTYELITECEHELAGRPELYEGNPVIIGNDIARRNDLWVAWVLEPVGVKWWTREIRVLKGATFATHDAVMDELVAYYKLGRLFMDQTGIGEKPVEDARHRYGETRVEGVIFNNSAKFELAKAGKRAFEDRKLWIPDGDTKLRADLHKIKKENTETGLPKFTADSNAEGHADRAWSCFLACYGAGIPFVPIEFQSTGDRRVSLDTSDHDGGVLPSGSKGFGSTGGGINFGGF